MKKRKTIGYGFVCAWKDGTLGGYLPDHLEAAPKNGKGKTKGFIGRPKITDTNWCEKSFLCKITVEEVLGKNGKRIVKHLYK